VNELFKKIGQKNNGLDFKGDRDPDSNQKCVTIYFLQALRSFLVCMQWNYPLWKIPLLRNMYYSGIIKLLREI